MKTQALFIAQPSYTETVGEEKVWKDLPLAAQSARRLAEDLTRRGYDLGRMELLDGGDKPTIETALDAWFRKDVVAGSRLIVFWTGHGFSDGKNHFLVCRNSPKGQNEISSANAMPSAVLGELIAKSKAEKILVVLDACYSGQGAEGMAESLGGILAARTEAAGEERAFAIIASSHYQVKSKEGVFTEAMRAALLESDLPAAKRAWTDNSATIHTDALCASCYSLMPPGLSRPRYKVDGFGQDFIPNPRYRENLPAEIVEERQQRLTRSEGSEHFILASRGIEVGETGWFFSGRRRLLAELCDWLETANNGVRIVTGPPGGGKSAVLGRLASLSDPDYRHRAIDEGAVVEGEDPLPRPDIIDVAVHAKGKTLDDCARALAKGLRIEVGSAASLDVEHLVEEIGGLDRNLTFVVDALDEAASGQGAAIAARLIVPLGRLPKVKVLVGTRRSLDGKAISEAEARHDRLRRAFPHEATINDLDDETQSQSDIATYVRRRLLGSEKHRHADPALIEHVADQVAQQAGGVFLYARIVSRTLQDQDRHDGPLPASAPEAFEQDLAIRFKDDERRVNDLLGTLAWGEGKGLTRRIWPVVANALAQRQPPYADADVAWALDHAGWHIIEAGEEGQTVYRLAHQTLADGYRSTWDEREAQGRIVAALRRAPDGKDIGGSAWLDADKYLWRHLAGHAEAAGMLGDLIRDPGYLAVADPSRLIVALPTVRTPQDRRYARIYERVLDRLADLKPLDRMPLLHMTALIEDPELAKALEPPAPTAWRCRWARVRPSTPHRTIGRHRSGVTSVALGEIDGAPVVVTGSGDKTIRLWDARSGAPIGPPLEEHAGRVTSLAFGNIDGVPVVVSGSQDMTLRLWDARSGAPIGAPLEGHSGWVDAVAFGDIDGAPVVVSGGGWDKTIRLWDARSGAPIGPPLEGHSGLVTAVALGEIDGAPVVVSGSQDNTLRLWNARSGAPIGPPLEGHSDWVTSVAFGSIDGAPVVVSGSDDNSLRLWDGRSRAPIGAPLEGHSDGIRTVGLGEIHGAPVVVSGSQDMTLRLWDARSGAPIGAPLEGHSGWVCAVALGEMDGAPVVVSGSSDNTLRLWDARSRAPIGDLLEGHSGLVTSVALGEIEGAPVVVSGSKDMTLRLWDARSGAPIGSPLKGHSGRVTSVAFGSIDGAPVVVSGSQDMTLRLWDARSGAPICAPLEGHSGLVTSVAFGEIEGAPVIVSGSEDRTIRLWDPLCGAPIGGPLEGHSGWVCAVALGEIEGAPVLVSGSWDRTIRLWDARSRAPIGAPLEGHSDGIRTVGLGEIHGAPVVVSGSEDKSVRLWDARSSAPIGAPLEGHSGPVTSVALGEIDGAPVVISGSTDGVLYVWKYSNGDERPPQRCELSQLLFSVGIGGDGLIFAGTARGLICAEIRRS